MPRRKDTAVNILNTLRIIAGLRALLTFVLSLFGGEENKTPTHGDEPVRTTLTRVERDGSLIVERYERMADGSEFRSREVSPRP
jgi:hypothetical protein